MADPAFRPITPRSLGRNAYVPENDPEFMRRQQEPSSYDLFKQSVIQKVYDEALRATGSEERAREAASSASRKMFRTELTGSALVPEAAMAGAGRAVNIAKGLFGRGQAAESASPLLLAPPRRNAMMPDEMLAADTPSVLRMAPDRPPSLANSQSLPRLEYDIPTIRSTGMPPARDVVSSPFDDIGRLAGEGRFVDDPIAASQQAYQGRAAAEANRVSSMRDEGNTAVDEILRKRGLAAQEEAAFKARQLADAEGEGMFALQSPYQGRQAAEQAIQEARVNQMVNEGGGGAISRTPPPGTRFTMGDSSSSGVYRPDFTMPSGSQFGLPAVRGGTDVATMGAPASAPAAGGYDVGAILRMLGGAGMGGGATATALNAARDLRGEGQAGASVPNNPPSPLAGTGVAEQMFDRPGLPDDALGGVPSSYGSDLMPSRPGLPDDTLGGTSMPAVPRRMSAPQSAAASAAPASDPASVAMFQAYLDDMMQGDGGGRADLFFRADRERMKEQGLARGGQANGSGKSASSGKDAAMHKALEIIHHMMVNR